MQFFQKFWSQEVSWEGKKKPREIISRTWPRKLLYEKCLQGRNNWKQRRLCLDRCPLVPPGVDCLKEPKHSAIKNHLGIISGLYLDKQRETQRRFNLSGHSEHVHCGARRQSLGEFSLRNQRCFLGSWDHCLHVPIHYFFFPEC